MQEALGHDLQEMHGVHRLDDAQVPRSAPGLELGGLRPGVDGSDAEGEWRGLLRRVCALVVGMGNAVDEGAGKRLRLVRRRG